MYRSLDLTKGFFRHSNNLKESMTISFYVLAYIRTDVNTDIKEDLLDHAEKYMTVKMYANLFCPPMTDDEQKDLQMQTQIRSLHWVSAQQLDTLINEHIPEIRALIDQAITGNYCKISL